MTDPLDTLRPELRESLKVMDRSLPIETDGRITAWGVIRAELLRLAKIEKDYSFAIDCERRRAEKAEAELADLRALCKAVNETAAENTKELAALKAKIADCPECDADELYIFGVPREWIGKRVRLLVDEPQNDNAKEDRGRG